MTCVVTTVPSQSTTITGDVNALPGGLKSGKETQMTIDDSQWWPVPATPYPNRQGVGIQNEESLAAKKLRVNFDNTAPFVGTIIYAYGERFYQVDDSVIIYVKAFPGQTIVLNIEELASV